jgi:hypothetical protein
MAAIAVNAGEVGRGTAATLKSGAENLLRFSLAALPLYPAVQINLDAAAGQGETWAVVGIGFVIFGALAIEHTFHALGNRQGVTALLWASLGVAFLGLNGMNAIANLASHTDHSRDENRARMQTAADITTQRTDLTARRKAQAALAGEATPESIEAEIKAARAANSPLWRASENCDPNRISRDVTKAFCKGLADMEAKKAAAVKRDELDAKLAKLDEKAETKGEAPSTVDSFADAMADGLSAFGYEVKEKDKLAIVRVRDWSKAIGVEVLAAFGPAALLGLFLRGNAPLPMPKPLPVRVAVAAPSAKPRRLGFLLSGILATPAKAEPAARPDLGAVSEAPRDLAAEFASECLDHSPGAVISNPSMWAAWAAYCARRNADPGTKKGLQARLKNYAVYENNNNRPRYVNVRVKAVPHAHAHGGPRPRLAVSNV